ncbi:MAG: hypothetical protein EOP51_22510, partial [Sphingobacteriales bacterium]
MKTTLNKPFRGMPRRRHLLAIILFSLAFARSVSAQTLPYVTMASGGTCYGQSANLIIVGATATSWGTSPYVAGGVTNPTSTGATINFIAYGTYTLYVPYINGPISQPTGTLTLSMTVNPLIHPTLAVTPSFTTACVGTTVTYTPTATDYAGHYSTKWSVDGGPVTYTYNGDPFSTSTLSVGSHIIKCELSPGTSCSSPATVIVNTTTTITGAMGVSANVPICPGSSTTLTATGASSYTWSPATGLNTTTGASVIASPAVTTTYTVTGGNCSTPKQVTVTVNPISALTSSPCQPPTGTAGGTFGGTSIRKSTPVVLNGSAFTSTLVNNFNAADLVAFAYNSGNWTQVPLQVDERKQVNAGTIYNASGYNYNSLQYADVNTWVGADATATFDADDELVFMARDAGGGLAPDAALLPGGVVATAGAQIKLTDPNNAGTAASYLYIFKKDAIAGLQQSAGKSYVNYDFKFKVGSTVYGPTQYKANYTLPHHLENSTVTSPYYSIGFSDRWIEDDVKVTIANSAGIDMIDRHRNQFNDGCENEDSFSNCSGVYVTNKSGPVRGIRSYMGACSGPLTQREHFFYDQFESIKTVLRVHTLPGMKDFWDYNPGAGNMRYSNNLNTTGGTTDAGTGMTGIPVDGTADVVATGVLTWQLMSSASGSIFRKYDLTHDIGVNLAVGSYYLDAATRSLTPNTPTFQCPYDDGQARGSSGLFINQSVVAAPYNFIPCTDPLNTNAGQTFNGSLFQNAQLIETNVFLKPSTPRTDAPALTANVTPLTTQVIKWPTDGHLGKAPGKNQFSVADEVVNAVNIYPNPSAGVVNV